MRRWLAWLAFALGAGACGKGAPGGPPIDVVVVAPRAYILGKDVSKPIGDAEVAIIRARPEVAAVVPRMDLGGRALGVFSLDGQEIKFEVGGFADGIPAGAIEPELADRFVDGDPAGDQPVPVIVSPTLLSLYNDRYAKQHGLPHFGEAEVFLASRSERLRFTIELGNTMITGVGEPPVVKRRVTARVVGVSKQARPIGLTVPMSHVAAWNRELVDEHAATHYTSLTVTLRGAGRKAAFDAWLKKDLGLELQVEYPPVPEGP
jgi:putative ABC transport system permease protein